MCAFVQNFIRTIISIFFIPEDLVPGTTNDFYFIFSLVVLLKIQQEKFVEMGIKLTLTINITIFYEIAAAVSTMDCHGKKGKNIRY